MVHTILINDDNTITKHMNGAIMQGSENVDSLRILVNQNYIDGSKNTCMKDFSCVIEFTSNDGIDYRPKLLTPSDELYKGRVEYLLPITLDMTRKSGKLEFKFLFTKLNMNDDGSFKKQIRETSDSYLDIIPTKQWDNYMSDEDLRPLVDIMLTMQSKVNQLEAIVNRLNTMMSGDRFE